MTSLLLAIKKEFPAIFLTFGASLGFASVLWVPLRPVPPSGQTATGDDLFIDAQKKDVAKNLEALSFTIRLIDAKDSYQQGEIIRVELAFSSALPKTYQLDGALYDRGGRLGIDSYCVDPPDGAVDPLKDQSPGGMGGMRAIPVLEEKPYRIVRDLNEYLRFDKPGKYRLYVVSNRLQREPTEKERADKKQQSLVQVPVTSNIIELNIVPMDAEWAKKQYQSARTVLESSDRIELIHKDEEIRSAARVIRFLGTEDSVRYMVRHLDEDPGNFSFGLMGSPFAMTVVRELEDGLEAPDCAVSSSYLWVLSSCSFLQRYSHRPAPYPGTEDAGKLELWRQEDAKAQLARKALREEYLKRLSAAVLKKEGRAKAVSLNTLLGETANGPSGWRTLLPAEFVEKLSHELTRVFFDLPAVTQRSLLQHQWSWIKGQGMMPVLERYYENPTQGTDWIDPAAAGIALQRIYELDPRRGRELILREIAHPSGRVRFEVLAMLPDKTLPELDEAIASSLGERGNVNFERMSLQAQLLARYATPDVLPRVRQAQLQWDAAWPCEVQAPILAYYLQVAPEFGAEELEKALSPAASTNGCHSGVLGSVARLYACPQLDEAAIRRLDDRDPAVVLNAVETLGKYGSAAAEAPLWKRFTKWHDEWKDRAEEMQIHRIERRPELETPLRMESAFRIALANGRGWLADAEKLERIRELCLTEQERQQVGYAISEAAAAKKRLLFMPGPGDTWRFQVAQYWDLSPLDAVKAKLAQFPKGTVFVWTPFNEGQAEEQKKAVLEELKTFLVGLGMSLEEQQPPIMR
jgi:hypothetical protein